MRRAQQQIDHVDVALARGKNQQRVAVGVRSVRLDAAVEQTREFIRTVEARSGNRIVVAARKQGGRRGMRQTGSARPRARRISGAFQISRQKRRLKFSLLACATSVSDSPRSFAISSATNYHVGGLIGLAAMGHRREIGESVSISNRSSGTWRATSLSALALRKVTMPEGDVEAELEAASATSWVSVKQCITPRFACALFAHQAQGVCGGVAGVDDERLGAGPRSPDVSSETLALPLRLVLVPIVIQPGFADRHHLGMTGQLEQLFEARLGDIVAIRVHPTEAKRLS